MLTQISTGSVYVASGLQNYERISTLMIKLIGFGVGITYDWTPHAHAWFSTGVAATTPEVSGDPRRAGVIARSELAGVLAADVVLMVAPGGFGTYFEFGAACAAGKPVILLDDVGFTNEVIKPFHYLPNVSLHKTETAALAAVLDALAVVKAAAQYPHQGDQPCSIH